MINSRDIDIKILTVNEACAKLYAFFQKPSIEIDPRPFGNDHYNKLFDAQSSQSIINTESLSSDIQRKLSQIPVMLCEIEKLQSSLNMNNNEDATDSTLEQKRDLRDKLSNDLCVNLTALMDSNEIRKLSHPQSGKKLDELLYEIALVLANLNPVNDIDFATQEPIALVNRIVTSDRYQHDINSLHQWLRHKNTNPWTNLQFSGRDLEFLLFNFKIRKQINVIEIGVGNRYPGGDPDLDATTALVRRLRLPESVPTRVNSDLEQQYYHQTLNIPHLRTRPSDAISRPRAERVIRAMASILVRHYLFEEHDYHHRVIHTTNHSTLGFFRQQPTEAHRRRRLEQISESEALARSYYAPTPSVPYADIPVTDNIPTYNELVQQTPFYWRTQQRQTESEQEQQASFLPKP